MDGALEWGLPGVFHTYLEDSPVHVAWLTEYLRLNPSQHFIATGFDRGGANDERFVRRRFEMLAEVERGIGRPLHVVFCNLLTRLDRAREASRLFPGRVHLVGQSVFLRSVKGSALSVDQDGRLQWQERAQQHPRGVDLFRHNAEILERAVAEHCHGFFTSGVVRPPHYAMWTGSVEGSPACQ